MLILREYEIRLIYLDKGLDTCYYTIFNSFASCVPLQHRYIATELTDVLSVANSIDVHSYELSNIAKGKIKIKIQIWAIDWETNKQGEILDHIQDRLEKTVFSNIKFQLDVTDIEGVKVLRY